MKKKIKWYTTQKLDFVWFKAKTLMLLAFIVGMLTTAIIYLALNIITRGA